MFSVIKTIEIGQPPTLRQDCAGQIWSSVIEVSTERNVINGIRNAYSHSLWYSDVPGRAPWAVRYLAVVSRVEACQHPAIALAPAPSSWLIQSPPQVSASVHCTWSAYLQVSDSNHEWCDQGTRIIEQYKMTMTVLLPSSTSYMTLVLSYSIPSHFWYLGDRW